MDRVIYLTMAGAKAAMQRQDVVSNNLSNVSTTGFRAELTAFRAVPVRGDGASTRVYALESTPGYNAEAGPVQATDNPLDVALKGNAWLAVQGIDGTEAYTRSGGMEVASDGLLRLRNGLAVLGDGGPIGVPANAKLDISSDGLITATVAGSPPQGIGRLKLVTPEAPLQRGDDGLFRAADGADLPADANARLQSGALEGSNVGAVESMVAMISAARQFEQQMKMLQTAQERETSATRLLSNT
ncbi:flagellar basal body rod protein FlgF [Pseudaquabacterium rugosum]|jgi:flagellar basal-body rod protein FlgF|uniref:Flagellar basal-body rod protein FlgF n=1 Tax=Pseudaquabacterium rugosum TaxID=2984194 RepID=A0ABU9B6K9_9BURK